MRNGFTLLEVVVALVVLEVCLIGAFGMLTLANRSLTRAERLERATATLEGVVDSLASATSLESGRRAVSSSDTVTWRTVDGSVFEVIYLMETVPAASVVGRSRRGILGGPGGA